MVAIEDLFREAKKRREKLFCFGYDGPEGERKKIQNKDDQIFLLDFFLLTIRGMQYQY